MQAFPEPPSFYPVISMPVVTSPIPGNVCPPPRMRMPFPPPSPPPSFQPLNMPPPPPMGMPPKPFPPPDTSRSPSALPPRPFPPPPPDMMSVPISMPPKPLFPPPHVQSPNTPPPSAPSSPHPFLELNQQNDILTQRWNWLPSMLCSIANDHSGAVYKIISITWDGFSKECYLHKYCPDGESKPEDDKDVAERDLVPVARPREVPRELTPPPSNRERSPPASDPSFDEAVPIRVDSYNGGGGPVVYAGDEMGTHSSFSSSRPSDVGEYQNEDDEETHDSRPPLSPAMAERGVFPADEDYYSRGNWSYNGDNEDGYSHNDGNYGSENQGCVALSPSANHQGFMPLGPQEHPGFVTLAPQDDPDFVALGKSQTHYSELEPLGGQSERSERSGKRSTGSHGKKKRSHGEKSDKERTGEKSKSRSKSESKSRSRRNSTSFKDEKKEEKKDSSHRGERLRQSRKPSLFALPKF